MNYEVARNRLASHGNLPGTEIPEIESFVWHLRNADRTGCVPDLAGILQDVIDCLNVVNLEMNGPVPSENRASDRHDRVVLDCAYSVSNILVDGIRYHRTWQRMQRFDSATCDLLEDCIYVIAYAWDQVLAGDMDDILAGCAIR